MECLIASRQDISIDEGVIFLRGEEAHHASRVLRLRKDEQMLVTDLEGIAYRCRFIGLDGSDVECRIDEVLPAFGEPSRDVRLIQGMIAQPARWEVLLEKAVELGVGSICAVRTERTEKREAKPERWERIIRAAVKQSKRSKLPEIRTSSGELSSLSEALSEAALEGRKLLMLHESAPVGDTLIRELTGGTSEPLALVIGPEGGFTDAEVALAREKFGAKICSLGSRRLRAETAAIAALALVSAFE